MDKILFFQPQNDYTGSTRVLANVIETEYADKLVTIITLNKKSGFLSSLSNVCFIPLCYPTYKGKRLRFISALILQFHAWILTFVHGLRYDTFYINTILPYYAAVVGRIYRKKIIYHIHEKFLDRSLLTRGVECIFNHTPAKRIFVSKYLMEQYPANWNCESVIHYNKLPLSFLSKVKVKPIERRERKVVIMICSLSKVKGIFNYIEVAKKLPQFRFSLIISSDMTKINSFLSGTEIPANVELIPTQADIHPYLASSDLLMNMSIPFLCVETFGLTILEGMAYGLPAIVPNVGGPTEIVTDGYNGYCVEVTDVDVVARAVKSVMEEATYKRMVENALVRYKEICE